MFQKIISYFVFSSKILKHFVELYHQIGIIVLYESISRGLQINAKAIIEEIINKTRFYRFFILYNNINFYKHVWNQQLYNWSILINYTAGYIYFMKTSEEGEEDNTWLESYIVLIQINQRLVNDFINKDFNFKKTDLNY